MTAFDEGRNERVGRGGEGGEGGGEGGREGGRKGGDERIVAAEPDLRQYSGVGGIPSKPPRELSASLSLPIPSRARY